MGDGGDGGSAGEVIDYSGAELPVDIESATVLAAAAGGGDGLEDLGVTGGGVGGTENERRPDDEVIELIWRDAPPEE